MSIFLSLLFLLSPGEESKPVRYVGFTMPKELGLVPEKGNTPLHIAARYGKVSDVKRALEESGKINKKNKAGCTAFMIAAAFDHRDVLDLLEEAGAKTKLKNKDNYTAMHLAAIYDASDSLEWFKERGENTGLVEFYRMPSLIRAMLAGRVEDFRKELEEGGHLGISDMVNNTAMQYMQALRNPKLYEVAATSGFQGSGLHQVIRQGSLEEVKAYLEAHEDKSPANHIKESPLMAAAIEGETAIVKLLLEHGADPNNYSAYYWTPLMAATANNDLEMVKALLAAGAKTDTPCDGGSTALSYAVHHDFSDVAKILNEAGDGVLYLDLKSKEMQRFKNQSLSQLKSIQDKAISKKSFRMTELPAYIAYRDHGKPHDLRFNREGKIEVSNPRFVHKVRPAYPSTAKTERIKGYVIVSAVMGKDGIVREFKVLKPLKNYGHAFELNALVALNQWRYQPGLLDGEPVDVRMTLKMNYDLY